MDEYPIIQNPFGNMGNTAHDPIYAMMVRRKKQLDNPDTPLPSELKYQDTDIMELEEFCRTHGILGFNCGNMNPKTALKILKGKMGIKDDYNNSVKSNNLLLG